MSATACGNCGTGLAATFLSCPACGTLRYSEKLNQLAAEAREAASPVDALAAWRQALDLLPPASSQHAIIREKIEALCHEVDRTETPKPGASKKWAGAGGAAAAALALLGKFKFLLVFVLTKAKLLALGLTKGGTILTMLASFGVYWTAWGWKFAAALVGSIYVHEMGHVAALRRFGIPASAPMFIPGIGAAVRLKQALHCPLEDARVGLAGPIWGLGAAALAALVAAGTGSPFWAAVASLGAWINLFNLLPVWQLDGSRAFRAMNRTQRWVAAAVIGGTFLATSETLLLLLLVVAIFRALGKDTTSDGDRRTLMEYALLIVALAALTRLQPAGL